MTQTLFTNHKNLGISFKEEFEKNLNNSISVKIASGYFGTSTIKRYENELIKIGLSGECKILIGMVFYGGVTAKQKEALEHIHLLLNNHNPDNGIYISISPYHGKIYSFKEEEKPETIYIGSSNFSEEGLLSRHECSALIENEITKAETSNYLDYLFNPTLAKPLHQVALTVKSSSTVSIAPSTLLADYEVNVASVPNINLAIGELDIELRVDDQPNSSLNLYFEKGRKNANGLYAPRPWYEIEITSAKKDRNNTFYPPSTLLPYGKNSRRGEFVAYAEDEGKYYKFDMVVCSDYGKAIFTRAESGGRSTLGKFIKGKLEKAGVLQFGDRITSETLSEYGRNYIKFIKITNSLYFIDF